MEKQTGKLQVKTISVPTHSTSLARALEIMFLLGIGAIAILLHARFKNPLSIPGHHGLEFMGLLMIGRMSSTLSYASSISSLGIGMLLLFPVFGFNDPLMGFNFMLPGFLLDIYYQLGGKLKKYAFFLAVIAGFSYMTIPFSRLIISTVTGYQYGAFIKHGFITPFISWFAFGLAGGLLGAGINNIFTKFLSKFSN